MSINKIIIAFIVILLLFSAYILYQLNTTKLPKTNVTIDKQTFLTEVATTSAQQEQGLSGRASLPQNQGMLFIFSKPAPYPFWMKDMKFPLDMIFINNSKIITIFQNVPVPKNPGDLSSLPVYTPKAPADQVLEINAGLSKKYDFKKGDTVTVDLKQ
jgi:uncharacterized protein